VGEWRADKRHDLHDQGTHTYPDDRKYEGEWRDGKPHGRGTMTYPDGGEYDGEWRDGQCHGQGIKTYDGKVDYRGKFVNNEPFGENFAGRCVICEDRPAAHAIVPCGHQCLCDGRNGCQDDDTCPLCRKAIKSIIRISPETGDAKCLTCGQEATYAYTECGHQCVCEDHAPDRRAIAPGACPQCNARSRAIKIFKS